MGKNKRTREQRLIQCPFDKSQHQINHSIEKDFPINYSIIKGLAAFSALKNNTSAFRRFCHRKGHKAEVLNFFCKTHSQLLCQLCLIDGGHLQGCQLDSSQELISSQVFKAESNKCRKQLEEHILDLKVQKMNMYEMFFGETKNFEFVCKQLQSIIQGQCEDHIKDYTTKYEKANKDAENQIAKM